MHKHNGKVITVLSIIDEMLEMEELKARSNYEEGDINHYNYHQGIITGILSVRELLDNRTKKEVSV